MARLVWWVMLFCVAGTVAPAQVGTLRSTRFAGREYVRAADVAGYYNLGSNRSGASGREEYRREALQFSLVAERRDIRLNNSQHWLNDPVVAVNGRLWISKADVLQNLDPILRPRQHRSAGKVRVIVLDPGHGGGDRGARGTTGRTEKELTLDLTKRVERHLAASGAKIYLTRRTDTTLALAERNAYERARKADLFVSLHFNAATSSARGIETFCLPPVGASSTASPRLRSGDRERQSGNRADPQNVWLAHCIQRSLIRATDAEDRGVRRARFQVLRDASSPAVLVEAGFLSNRNEESKILTPTYRETLAKAIAEGILAYVKSTE